MVLYRLKEVGDLRHFLLHLLVCFVIHEDFFECLELFLETLVFLDKHNFWPEFLLSVLLQVSPEEIEFKERLLAYHQVLVSCSRVICK